MDIALEFYFGYYAENAGFLELINVKKQVFYPLIFFISLVFFGLAQLLPSFSGTGLQESMRQAANRMELASQQIKGCREETGWRPDLKTDINATGLIGLEFSTITTSLGQLPAKRTTTNPNFAGLMVLLLSQAGVKRGDTVAVGASGSFPALLLAVISACRELDLKPLVIFSIGASQWGANDPDFHGLEIWDCLVKKGLWDLSPIALSMGGDRDIGENMPAEGYTLIKKSIEKSGVVFIDEPELTHNVAARMRFYKQAAGAAAIKAFVNIGGSYANLGIDSAVLAVKPGVSRINVIPPVDKRGVLFAMAAEKVPVIHLLFIRGLVGEYGLPWDPAPLPGPDIGRILQHAPIRGRLFSALALSYLLLVSALIYFYFQSRGSVL